ncbi:MAG: ABC-2 transporter permease, partial [Oscillibacter sp.]|nr:ABC-2 transporter permease [Oscillibacter sp.]MCI9003472.1 ABC-2 transporter permease [Oscillibacter sp.]
AYDERSHWNQLAAMMPYSKRDIVLSKYVLGWICMAAVGVFCLAVQAAAGIVSGSAPSVPTLLASLCVGIISLDITLPAVLRFGVERGRMIFMVLIFGVMISIGVLVDMVDELPSLSVPLAVLLPLGAAVGTALSIPLSMKLYKEN